MLKAYRIDRIDDSAFPPKTEKINSSIFESKSFEIV